LVEVTIALSDARVNAPQVLRGQNEGRDRKEGLGNRRTGEDEKDRPTEYSLPFGAYVSRPHFFAPVFPTLGRCSCYGRSCYATELARLLCLSKSDVQPLLRENMGTLDIHILTIMMYVGIITRTIFLGSIYGPAKHRRHPGHARHAHS
jgi:hypothetical protein